jgi:hypothetical protein
MVEQSVIGPDAVIQLRDGRVQDLLREAVALIAQELMDAAIGGDVGVGLGEVALELRVTHRNGDRPRVWEIRVGEIDLLVPRKRSGASYVGQLGVQGTAKSRISALGRELEERSRCSVRGRFRVPIRTCGWVPITWRSVTTAVVSKVVVVAYAVHNPVQGT